MKTLRFISGALSLAVAYSQCTVSQYVSGATCASYANPADKAAANYDYSVDTGSTAWILAATALTMLMTPAIGLFYAGLYKAEHAINTILLAFVGLAVISLEWILFGYSFAFGPGSPGYGNWKWGVYHHVAANPAGVYTINIPHILYAAFQNMFAAMAPAFLAGAVVGRMKFGTYIIFILLWTLVVYNCLAHWIWGNYVDPDTWLPTRLGWLASRGTIDYAGGAVIHITAGFAALAVTLVLGKRREYNPHIRVPTRAVLRGPRSHNLPLVAIGFTLLWVGWFGYTGGANGTANGVAAHAVIATHVSACTAMLWWLIIEYMIDRRVTLTGAAFGALCGLVAITPAAGYVWPWHALIFGIFAASFGFLFSRLKYVVRFDDPFDVFAIHGVCGCVGMFMTGLFASPEVNPAIVGGAFYGERILLGWQMAGIVVAAAFSFVCTFIIVWILKKTIGIRVPEKEEDFGLDAYYHGAPAYYFEEPIIGDTPANRGEVLTKADEHHHEHHHHDQHHHVTTTEGALKKDEHVISS